MIDDAEIKSQVERLEGARRDPRLLARVGKVVAAQFGAIPIGAPAPDALEVALATGTSQAVVAGLRRVLGLQIIPAYFDENLVHLFVSRLYLQNDTLNFHTFTDEGFLERDANVPLLKAETPMEPVPTRNALPPDRVIALDYAYRSVLETVDRRHIAVNFEEQKEAATDLHVAIEEPPGEEPLLRCARKGGDLPSTVFLVAQESYSYAGLEHRHGWRAHEVKALPHMVHPSEIQVTDALPDGSIQLYVYDRIERVRPGETPRFDVTYYFLSMGQRLRRRLIVKVYGLWSVPRARVRCSTAALPWSAAHLERWLGHDLA